MNAITPVPVCVSAPDPISRHGLLAQLRTRPEIEILPEGRERDGAVILAVVDHLDDSATDILRRLRGAGRAPVVLVVSHVDDQGLAAAVEGGVVGVLRRVDATSERLAGVIRSAVRGEGSLPGDLLGRLLDQVGRIQRDLRDPSGVPPRGLSGREADVLRLAADGRETREIAAELSYSERTVKNVLHGLTTRFNLRNRTHAVAYALRNGLI